MNKDPRIFLGHIIESIGYIEEYTRGKTREDFLHIVELQDKVVRRLEIIGEAVRHLSVTLKSEHPDVPWKEIAGMRDVLIHEYFGIDMELTWEAATIDVLKLKRRVIKIKQRLDNNTV